MAARALVIDLETYDPDIDKLGPGWAMNSGTIVGYGIGIPGHHTHTRYVSVRHKGYPNAMDPDKARSLFKEILRLPIPKIFFNAPYDMGWLKREGVEVAGPCYCAMEAAALIDERRPSYSLNNVGGWMLGRQKLDIGVAGSDLYKTDPKLVGEYCCGDVDLTGDVWLKQEPVLKKEELWDVFKLESELLPLWVQMRWNGISIDEVKLGLLKKKMIDESQLLIQQVRNQYKVPVDIWKASSIAKLCDQEGIEYDHTPTGKPSFTKLSLANHPALINIAAARKLDKIANTFLVGLQRYLINGKVHAEIHPMKSDDGGTVTGRLSISHPGLHQMPGKRSGKDLGKLIRSLFIPSKGRKIASLDYSQQEPRLQIHYAAVLGLQGAREAVKQFTDNPRTDYHQFTANLINFPRDEAKIINLGLAYGMGRYKLSVSLGCTVEEANKKLDVYYQGMPWMRELQRICANKAADRGYIRTILGRRCRYNDWEPVTKTRGDPSPMARELAEEQWPDQPLRRAYTYRGMNGLIQGGAADQIKKAMRDLYYENGVVPLLQMHDELLVEIMSKDQAKQYSWMMENAIKLKVPVVVDTAIGKSWGDCL
jgi:DNA polymerase I-like protein with 3'-5' exonuclease and polymerase domains